MRKPDPTKAARKLVKAEVRHLREVARLRSRYEEMLRKADAKRLDANMAAARSELAAAAERAVSEAGKLAVQLATSIEAMTKRISDAERAMAEGRGRSGISTPLLMAIAAVVAGAVVYAVQHLK